MPVGGASPGYQEATNGKNDEVGLKKKISLFIDSKINHLFKKYYEIAAIV